MKKKSALKEIVAWDVINWSKAIDFWEENASVKDKNYQCLELGASRGGISLWLAQNNNEVLCTDLNGPKKEAQVLHEKHNCVAQIKYAPMDATNIPYNNHFDLVVFKSILGGICYNRNEYKKRTLDEIHKALKPGGTLLFAENLEATVVHKYFRKHYGTKNWNYLHVKEMGDVFSSFSTLNYKTVGFFGCFGRNETQRTVFGHIDTVVEKVLPDNYKYILIGTAQKDTAN